MASTHATPRDAACPDLARARAQVDEIFKAAALAANAQRIPLAKMAVQETGMGIVEDKARVSVGAS